MNPLLSSADNPPTTPLLGRAVSRTHAGFPCLDVFPLHCPSSHALRCVSRPSNNFRPIVKFNGRILFDPLNQVARHRAESSQPAPTYRPCAPTATCTPPPAQPSSLPHHDDVFAMHSCDSIERRPVVNSLPFKGRQIAICGLLYCAPLEITMLLVASAVRHPAQPCKVGVYKSRLARYARSNLRADFKGLRGCPIRQFLS